MNRPQFGRIVYIHDRIKQGRYPNARELAEELEVTTRTIMRDIDYLRDQCRAPLEYDSRRRGFYYSEPTFSLPSLQITEGEVLAVVLSLSLLQAHGGTSLDKAVRSVADKLPHLLPDHVSIDMNGLSRAVSFSVEPLRGEQEKVSRVFDILSTAIREHRRLEMSYFTASRGEWTQRKVDPYHVRHMDGVWYLLAHCHLRATERLFALDRMEDVRLLKERFTPVPSSFVDEYFRGAWRIEKGEIEHRVVIRFSPDAAVYIRGKKWHETQQVTELPDKSLLLAVTVTGPGEVLRWVMQFGSGAEILEPLELRNRIAEELAEAAGIYADNCPTKSEGDLFGGLPEERGA